VSRAESHILKGNRAGEWIRWSRVRIADGSVRASPAGCHPFKGRVGKAADTGLDHGDREPVSPHLGQAQQADESFELAAHGRPPVHLIEQISMTSVV
jgi:hypothetical protein